jgi:hypothetical protein
MPAERYAQLRAYGLAPAARFCTRIPLTVIRFEHLELALEHSLVSEIQVTLQA